MIIPKTLAEFLSHFKQDTKVGVIRMSYADFTLLEQLCLKEKGKDTAMPEYLRHPCVNNTIIMIDTEEKHKIDAI